MTTSCSRFHHAPPPTTALRLSILNRRVSVSEPLAGLISDLAFGSRARDHADMLPAIVSARVAAARSPS